MAIPKPLPPAREDPAIKRGYTLTDEYTAAAAAVRADMTISDLEVARRIDDLWRNVCDEINAAAEDHRTRRQARLDYLEQQIPFGPGVPESTSQADKVVIMAAWGAALERARNASGQERQQMLTDGQQFGDDLAVRAVLTASQQDGASNLVHDWINSDPTRSERFGEWVRLTGGNGGFTEALIARQAFDLPPQPAESKQLPDLELAAAAAIAQRVGTTRPHSWQR